MNNTTTIRTGDGFLPVNQRGIEAGSSWTATQPAALWTNLIAPKSVFLSQLPASNKLTMHTDSLMLPAIKTGDSGFLAPGAEIPEPATTVTGRTCYVAKFGALERASSEVLQDARPDLTAGINQSMAASMARGIDNGLFNGAAPADVNDKRRIYGLLAQGVTTKEAPKVATLSKAITRMETIGAFPSVIWCDPLAAEALRAEIPAADWPKGIYGLVPMVTPFLPANTAVVADASQLYVGLHSDVSIATSLVSPGAFMEDRVLFRAIARIAGIWVQDPGCVQVVSATLPNNTPNLMMLADQHTPDLNSPEMIALMMEKHDAEVAARKADPNRNIGVGAQSLTDDQAQQLRQRQRQAKAAELVKADDPA